MASGFEIVPEGTDPDESPFALQAIEGLPFDEDSEEARAIREVIEQAELERSDASRIRASGQRKNSA